MPALLISVRFHDGRYHGAGDWPPAPARLFQALVAAAPKTGDALEESCRDALAWLEQQSAPVIAAPPMYPGQFLKRFEPNNDLDAKGGDIRRIAEVRGATKEVRPKLFDASVPLLYVWRFDRDDAQAKGVCNIADGLYQLGRGVDMAWATAEVFADETAAQAKLIGYQGVIYRPSESENSLGGVELACPEQGSLESLELRYRTGETRFRRVQDGRTTKTEFSNAPKPRFRPVVYDSPATRLLFELRRTTESGAPFAPWPLKQAAALVQKLRDGAVVRLSHKDLSKHFDAGTINKVLIGKEATEADKALRIRIVPLPSIGHAQVNRSIRRVLVDVPPDCPIRADDVAWAFAGLELPASSVDEETGEMLISPVELVRADDESMLAHYGVGQHGLSSRVWRSVTPLALPDVAKRRGMDSARSKEEARNGSTRQAKNRSAVHAVAQALRHVGLRQCVANIRVQREPFEVKGERAEVFSAGTRFSGRQLWHVEIEFTEAVDGPVVLGNGRYAGLGLMAPVKKVEGVYAFEIIGGLADQADQLTLGRALRRAVMARAQDHIGKRGHLPVFFTGHEADGAPARGGNHTHLAFVPDLERRRLLVIAPHIIEHREPSPEERRHLDVLAQVLRGFEILRAGSNGELRLAPDIVDTDSDPLFSASMLWIAQTPYIATRHAKKNGEDSLRYDVLREVRRRGLPVPEVSMNGNLALKFNVAVPGPVLLGKNMHYGGGLFAAPPSEAGRTG